MTEQLEAELAEMRAQIARLTAEADARRTLGRYMYICDVPIPEFGMDTSGRVKAIASLFTDDAIWEGVGGTHGAQFGRHIGPAAIAEHMRGFYDVREPRQIFNTHYLCTEQLRSDGETVEGNWVQFQPWIDASGASLLRSSRLHVRFRRVNGAMLIAHYRTENLFIAALPDGWAQTFLTTAYLMEPKP